MTNHTQQDYQDAIIRALPQGPAFPREGAPTRDAIAGELATEDALTGTLITESNPATTSAMLLEWEQDYGLPDCAEHAPTTTPDRVTALVTKITRAGSYNPNALKQFCKDLGYAVEIIERRPFRCGISQCGSSHKTTSPDCRFWLTVKVLGPRATSFRCGVSRCGEKLLAITPADALTCNLPLINQAHMSLTFAYEGA